MARYQVFDPNTELNGRTVTAFIKNMNHEDIENILIKHHLDKIDPNQWYKLQSVLDVMNDISDNVNASENLVAIGMAAAQVALANLPPEFENATAEQWLTAYCEKIYPSRQRNGYCGEISLQRENDKHLTIRMYSPYPDDLMYGLFYTYVRHFIPAGQKFVVRYDEKSPRREQGGPNTIYHILFD